MAKAKNTRELSDAHENYLADVYPGGRRSPSSGATWNDPVDVTTDYHVIEAKSTEGESISFKKKDWLAIKDKAEGGRTPAMAFRFKDPYSTKSIDLICYEVNDDLELRERLGDR